MHEKKMLKKRAPIRSQPEHARIFNSLPSPRAHTHIVSNTERHRCASRTQPQLTFTLATPFSAISTPRRNQFVRWMPFMRLAHVIGRLGGGVVITADRGAVAGAPIGRIIVLIHDGGVRPLCVVAVGVCVAFVADARRGQPIVNHSDVARLLRALGGTLSPRRSLALA